MNGDKDRNFKENDLKIRDLRQIFEKIRASAYTFTKIPLYYCIENIKCFVQNTVSCNSTSLSVNETKKKTMCFGLQLEIKFSETFDNILSYFCNLSSFFKIKF